VLDLKNTWPHDTCKASQLASCSRACWLQTVNHDALHPDWTVTYLADTVHAAAANPVCVQRRLCCTRSLDVAAQSENGLSVRPAHSHGSPCHHLFFVLMTLSPQSGWISRCQGRVTNSLLRRPVAYFTIFNSGHPLVC
jgi:hypothetical protein